MKAREKTQLEISDVVAKESRDDRDISEKQGLCSIGTAYILSIVPAAHFRVSRACFQFRVQYPEERSLASSRVLESYPWYSGRNELN